MFRANTKLVETNLNNIKDLEAVFQNPIYISASDMSNIPLLSFVNQQKSDKNCVGIKFKIISNFIPSSLLSENRTSYILRKSEMLLSRNTLSKYYDVFQIQSIKIDGKETDYDLIALNISDENIYTLGKHEIIPNDNLCHRNEFQYIAKICTEPYFKHQNIEVEYQVYVLDSTLRKEISETMKTAKMMLPL